MSETSIRVEYVEETNILRMVWDHTVKPADVKPAFETIISTLDAAADPVYIIVDLNSDPKFPLAEVTMHAVPACRHFRIAGWLVVGTNKSAQYISKFLGTATGRNNVLWFDTDEAMRYIAEHPTASI